MEAKGKLVSITKQLNGNGFVVTLNVDTLPVGLENKELKVSLTEYKPHRSKDANALLWACIGDIAHAIQEDPWTIYLQMLKSYGKFTYIVCKPYMVDAVKQQWRECEIVGKCYVEGKNKQMVEAVQLLCFFGSSTYNTKEMSDLLTGVLCEMDQMGLQKPPSSGIRRALEEWERRHGKNTE